MKDISFSNGLARAIAAQVKTFEKTLPQDEQVGIVYGGNVIAVQGITALLEFGFIAIQGLCKTACPPLVAGAPVRVVLEPTLQGLTLTSVPRTGRELRPPIGFEVLGKEPVQG